MAKAYHIYHKMDGQWRREGIAVDEKSLPGMIVNAKRLDEQRKQSTRGVRGMEPRIVAFDDQDVEPPKHLNEVEMSKLRIVFSC